MTKIMLVEDDKSLREIYGIRLLAEGYEIKSAGDGEEALAMAIKERPDLIISDVMMPKISGFDMLDILRATPETKDIKIIMMTALSSEDQRARGESLGANRYLVKSQVGIEDVVRTVHDVLADAPAVAKPAAPLFGSPKPSAVVSPRPIAQPPQPAPVPAYAPKPIPAPAAEPTPSQNSMMPQPTAPFSTAAPASLGDSMMNNPTQPAMPTPVVKAPEPFTLPPQPQPAVQPEPVAPVPAPAPKSINIPVTTPSEPAPASAPAVTPVIEPTPVSIPVTSPAPVQDIMPPQQTTTTPDIATLMARELNGHLDAPEKPVQ